MNARLGGMAVVLALASCAGTPPPPARPVPSPPVQSRDDPADGSWDWHGLVVVPFGTLLKESPTPLHEVLLFRDASQPDGGSAAKDCYGIDRTPPRFLGRTPDEYLVCFVDDRLSRLEATVRLAPAEVDPVFARACALWLRNSVPASGTDRLCEGRDGRVYFSGRLAKGPDGGVLSMTLTAATERDAEGSASSRP